MDRIIVTLLQHDADMIGIDVEVPSYVESTYLVEELFKKIKAPNGTDAGQYDIEFSLTRDDWQKVEKQYCFQDVGVYDGVYIRLMKNSRALSAPSITPNFIKKTRTLPQKRIVKPEINKEHSQLTQESPGVQQPPQASQNQQTQDGYIWKVID